LSSSSGAFGGVRKMPVYRQGETPPEWCELEAFGIVGLTAGESVGERRRAKKERVLVAAGNLQLRLPGGSLVLREGQFVDLADAGAGGLLRDDARG
jgi:hypothetical protein